MVSCFYIWSLSGSGIFLDGIICSLLSWFHPSTSYLSMFTFVHTLPPLVHIRSHIYLLLASAHTSNLLFTYVHTPCSPLTRIRSHTYFVLSLSPTFYGTYTFNLVFTTVIPPLVFFHVLITPLYSSSTYHLVSVTFFICYICTFVPSISYLSTSVLPSFL